MGGGPRADQSGDPAEEDAEGDEDGAAAGGCGGRLAQLEGPGGRVVRRPPSERSFCMN
jgi:hypothetical protein